MRTVIDQIGGEEAVARLVERFYDLVETHPDGAAILRMHLEGHGLAHVRPAQVEFLCGFFGGRRYYAERHGHMNLREIHAHVEIRAEDAEAWLGLMDRALAETGVEDSVRVPLGAAFRRAAMSLVNAR